MDAAEFFAPRGASVTVVEMLPEIGRDLDPVSKSGINELINKYGIKVLTKTKLTAVRDDSFVVLGETGEMTLPFNLGFVCLGMRAYDCHLPMLEDFCAKKGAALYSVGDCRRARKIIDGVREGHDILNIIFGEAGK